MTGTVLWEARMEGTFFWKARMDGATLTETQLQGASLRKASLQYASLSRAHLEDADLSEARLERANLSWALMNGANLAEASLEGTSLWNAQMERADLREARMDATTDPKGADFSSASLRGVNCVEVGLSQKQINGLFADSSMTLPVDREKPAHWPMWHLPVNDFYDEWRKWQADPEGYEPPQPPDDAAEKPAE